MEDCADVIVIHQLHKKLELSLIVRATVADFHILDIRTRVLAPRNKQLCTAIAMALPMTTFNTARLVAAVTQQVHAGALHHRLVLGLARLMALDVA